MYKILIRNLHAQGILGVNPQERTEPREIIINITLFTDLPIHIHFDDISGCVDYSLVANEVRSLVEKSQRFTVEALANDIAELCLKKSGVKKLLVRVEKPGALLHAESVGVEIERRN
jgi:FolB domain-containing protein